jgi:hypothetical protein
MEDPCQSNLLNVSQKFAALRTATDAQVDVQWLSLPLAAAGRIVTVCGDRHLADETNKWKEVESDLRSGSPQGDTGRARR